MRSRRGNQAAPAGLVGAEHHVMRIALGQVMTQTFAGHRKLSLRATGALVLGAALMLSPALLSSASAQLLGYASTSPMPFPSDDVMVAARRRRRRQRRAPGAAAARRRCLQHPRSAGHHRDRYRQHPALLRARPGPRHSLRRRRRPRWLYLVRRADRHPQGGMAGLASAGGNDRAPALSAALRGGRSRQSARRTGHVSRLQRVPHSRHQRSLDHRQVRLLGLHPPDQ